MRYLNFQLIQSFERKLDPSRKGISIFRSVATAWLPKTLESAAITSFVRTCGMFQNFGSNRI